MSDAAQLVYAPLGGAGEIGMNAYLYGYGPASKRRWILVDCGIGFGDMATAPGVEIMTPDVGYIAEMADQLDGIFITHAHEDHVGAVGRLWSQLGAPVYATAFTAHIAKRKLAEEGHSPKAVKVCEWETPVQVGPFAVEFLRVTHSTLDAAALAIRTPKGVIVHTGDFKMDDDPVVGPPASLAAFERLGREGVLAMACDSTNVFNPGHTRSEGSLRESLLEAIRGCEGAVAATSFASNVVRLKTLAEAAAACDRSVVVVGRAMRRMIEAAAETGVLTDFPSVISEEEAKSLPSAHVFYLMTGSQGEGRAALARVAAGTHPSVGLEEGDTVIFSSKTIPGNEVEVAKLYNRLSERGVRVIDGDMATIHASGHGYRDELAALWGAVKPQIALPMHGEHRHLVEHARSAKGWGAASAIVAPNGSLVALDGNAPEIVDEIPTGRIYLDGDTFVGSHDGVVRDRLKMARQGHAVVSIVVDEEGELVADPEVRLIGAPNGGDTPLAQAIGDAVDDAVSSASRKERASDDALEQIAVRAVRKICDRHWGKKPVTTAIVVRVD
jgi:ribonuclease J